MMFGSIGGGILIIMLVAALVLCILSCYLVSGSAMQAMAKSGYLPGYLAKLNSRGVPVRALVLTAVFNMFLICLDTDRHPDRIGIRICVRKCDQLDGLLQSKDGPKDVKTS